jgi:Protein of unknown function (DUF3318)
MKTNTLSMASGREVARLKLMIPDRLQDLVEIESIDTAKRLIATHKIDRFYCQIQIDSYRWQSVNVDLRNLLFWHEIAKIQNGAVQSDRGIYIAIAAGISIASLDLLAQNIGLLTTSLLIAGLASFRLYQRHIGEHHLQQLTTADRDAIELAVQFGYDRDIACDLLKAAIQTISNRSPNRWSRDRSATRLQVLSLSVDR